MIEVKRVKSLAEKRKFVDFPVKLYKGNEFFVPPLRSDELSVFKKKHPAYEESEAAFFLCFKDGKIAGRIAAIIQKAHNKKTGEKRVRFSRFDCIEDFEAAKALFDAAEKWAIEKGMEIIHGPLGFNDLDREGLLIEGFNELSTFEEQYNFPYYGDFIERCGYVKEIDWLEFKVFPHKEASERIKRITDIVLRKYKLKIVDRNMSKKKYIKEYADGIFEVLDAAYAPLHGTVPFNEKMRKQILTQFNLLIKTEFVFTLLTEDNKVAGFGMVFPSISKAIQKSKGRLTPAGIVRLIKAVKKPKIFDLALIAVLPEFQNKGLNAIMLSELMDMGRKYGIEYFETNLNLETNNKIMDSWEEIGEAVQHKRRRCYIKRLR